MGNDRTTPLDDLETQRRLARANQLAWGLMVGVAFAGFIGAQLFLRNDEVSAILGAACVVGMISRELIMLWIFRGSPPAAPTRTPRSEWLGTTIQIAFVMLLWLLPSIAEGHIPARAWAGAAITAGAFVAYNGWRQSRTGRPGRAIT